MASTSRATASYSIDHQRYNFQFSGQTFWEVKNGKITTQLRDLAYQSNTPEFWKSCDMLGGKVDVSARRRVQRRQGPARAESTRSATAVRSPDSHASTFSTRAAADQAHDLDGNRPRRCIDRALAFSKAEETFVIAQRRRAREPALRAQHARRPRARRPA